MIEDYLFQSQIDEENHIIATYYVKSTDFSKAIEGIAIGQSIGNPEVRTQRDSPDIMKNNLAKIVSQKSIKNEGIVKIAYPLINFDIREDGITQLLCTLMGGQMDMDIISSCRLLDIRFPSGFLNYFQGPKFGLENIMNRARAINRPFLGGIIKPKTGITTHQLKDLVSELLRGGVDFIKEDEILGNPSFCRFEERVKLISDLVNYFGNKEGREIFYAPCINSDYPHFLDRARFASENGAKAIHLNIWAGLPAYRALRDLNLDTAIFFQKSGDKVITGKNNAYSIDWSVVCKIARIVGCDFIHAGMWQGYLSDSKKELDKIMGILRNPLTPGSELGNGFYATMPSLSCGGHPGLVHTTVENFGTNLMMNIGGAIHGHPMGSEAGARAMRQAFDCLQNGEKICEYMKTHEELRMAIEKWGYAE